MDRLPIDAPRNERLEQLKMYYLKYLVEDPQDGTRFDCDILDMIETLRKKYEKDQ